MQNGGCVKKIIELEEDLRQAMLANDFAKLDTLIDGSLVFIGPDGSVATKQMDLEAHKNKLQKMSTLSPSEQQIKDCGSFVIVTVKMSVEGTYGECDITGKYRYLRVWKNLNGSWKLVAGSVTKIVD